MNQPHHVLKKRFWTPEKNEILLSMIGHHNYAEIAKKLDNTQDAVRHQARRLGYRLSNGTICKRDFARLYGYSWWQIERAIKKTRIHIKRATTKRMLINFDQEWKILTYLKKETMGLC